MGGGGGGDMSSLPSTIRQGVLALWLDTWLRTMGKQQGKLKCSKKEQLSESRQA